MNSVIKSKSVVYFSPFYLIIPNRFVLPNRWSIWFIRCLTYPLDFLGIKNLMAIPLTTATVKKRHSLEGNELSQGVDYIQFRLFVNTWISWRLSSVDCVHWFMSLVWGFFLANFNSELIFTMKSSFVLHWFSLTVESNFSQNLKHL